MRENTVLRYLTQPRGVCYWVVEETEGNIEYAPAAYLFEYGIWTVGFRDGTVKPTSPLEKAYGARRRLV